MGGAGARRVVLLRHGQTEYNVAGRLQGQVDIPLNEVGIEQARAASLVLMGVRPALIVTSDLGRAVETAQVVADAIGAGGGSGGMGGGSRGAGGGSGGAGGSVSVVPDPRLRERAFGRLEGMFDWQIRAQFPDVWAARRVGERLVGVGAEDRGEVGERFAAAVWEYLATLPEDATLLVVAHGACIALGITALLGLDPEEFTGIRGIGNCHWSVLGPSRVPGTLRLEAHNVGV